MKIALLKFDSMEFELPAFLWYHVCCPKPAFSNPYFAFQYGKGPRLNSMYPINKAVGVAYFNHTFCGLIVLLNRLCFIFTT